MLTPEQRSQRARIAANARWAKEADGLAATAKARSEFLNRFEAEVDPEGKYPPEMRCRMNGEGRGTINPGLNTQQTPATRSTARVPGTGDKVETSGRWSP